MRFTSRNSQITIETDHVVLNGVKYGITYRLKDDTKINFDNFTIKIRNGILTLIDISSDMIETFLLEESRYESEDNDVYIIKRNVHVSINKARTFIKYMDLEYPITCKKIVGTTDVYVCDAGNIQIPTKQNRNAKWNGMLISNLKK